MMIWSTKSQQKVNIFTIHQNVQNLTADPNLVNKWWFGQQKVNTLIIHQNVQNLTADSNLVKKGLVTLKKGLFYKQLASGWAFLPDVFSECFQNDYLKATGGWVGFFIWRFLWILPKRLSLTFFLICLYWMTNMNTFFEGEKGLGPTGPRFAPVGLIITK